MKSTVAAFWRRRSLIRALTVSNLKQTHRNTVLGYLWWLLDPIMMTAVFTVVMGFIRGRTRAWPAYPAFIMCGILSWKSFANTVTQSVNTVANSEGLIKSFDFPKAVLPISLVLSNQILFFFAQIPLVVLCLFLQFVVRAEQVHLGWMMLFVPVIALAQIALCLGAALLFSCFGVFFKDLGNIMVHFLRVMWWMSPGLYKITDVVKGYSGFANTDWSRFSSLYVLNPFAHIMEGYRSAIMYDSVPDLAGIAYALCVGLEAVAVGLFLFQRLEKKFAKLV